MISHDIANGFISVLDKINSHVFGDVSVNNIYLKEEDYSIDFSIIGKEVVELLNDKNCHLVDVNTDSFTLSINYIYLYCQIYNSDNYKSILIDEVIYTPPALRRALTFI